jgi:iron complex transport system ATP-binding protein
MPAETLLEARGLAWRAGGRTILGPLDLEVHGGECLAVVGPNGAGKTTLLRLLTGLLSPSAGELSFAGRPYGTLSRRELARRVAYVPQVRPQRVPFTVGELVLQGRYPHLSARRLAPAADDFAAAERALTIVGIEGLRNRPLDELSGGERQAAYIAAALAQAAPVLVLDEPTTHLDPRHQREVAALLAKLGREEGATVVLASHDLQLASRVADRVAALSQGRLLACDAPGRLLTPGLLADLFAAPFEVVHGGERPVPLLRMAP